MKISDEIANLAAAFGSMGADLKSHQDRLLAFARGLDEMISERADELAREKVGLEQGAALQVERLNAANHELMKQAAELSRHNREITLLGRMNDFLQTSTTETEAYSVIAETASQMFPGDSGAVLVLNASRNMLEAASVWGPLRLPHLIFPPGECWAHRRGQQHLVIGQEQRCAHVTADDRMYACLPLLAQGEALGILHLLDGETRGRAGDEARMQEKGRLAKVLADSIGLGIANLKMRESMRDASIRDPLTALFNRRYMEEALSQELYRSRRNATSLAVIMIDIDHFKRFNDSHGHDGGDAVLRSLGEFFTRHVRGSDIACRYGGEEFVLILSPSTAEGARQRAEKIRDSAAHLVVHHAHHDLDAVTLSLGVAMFPADGADAAAVIKAADVALYIAKRSGRNQVVVHAAAGDSLELPQA